MKWNAMTKQPRRGSNDVFAFSPVFFADVRSLSCLFHVQNVWMLHAFTLCLDVGGCLSHRGSYVESKNVEHPSFPLLLHPSRTKCMHTSCNLTLFLERVWVDVGNGLVSMLDALSESKDTRHPSFPPQTPFLTKCLEAPCSLTLLCLEGIRMMISLSSKLLALGP